MRIIRDSQPRARSTDPLTSHEAAASVKRDSQKHVLDCLRQIGPSTDERMIAQYMRGDWPMQSPSGLRTRRHELVEQGFVIADGTVRGGTGRTMITWRAL